MKMHYGMMGNELIVEQTILKKSPFNNQLKKGKKKGGERMNKNEAVLWSLNVAARLSHSSSFFSLSVVSSLYLLFHVSSGCFTLYDIMHDQCFVCMYCIITKD